MNKYCLCLTSLLFVFASSAYSSEMDELISMNPVEMSEAITTYISEKDHRESLSLIRDLFAHQAFNAKTSEGLTGAAQGLIKALSMPQAAEDKQVIIATEICRKLLSSNPYRDSLPKDQLIVVMTQAVEMTGALVQQLQSINTIVEAREAIKSEDVTLPSDDVDEEYENIHGVFARAGIASLKASLIHARNHLFEQNMVDATEIFVAALIKSGFTPEEAALIMKLSEVQE